MSHRSLVTGGAGFIGANLVRQLVEDDPDGAVLVVDKLTYAGNRAYLADLLDRIDFAEIDIADAHALEQTWREFAPTHVYHLAAESHVDRSISGPEPFIQSNVIGTFRLLECARRHWQSGQERFLHVSTDEVYGSLGAEGQFTETTAYAPS
ncbi:MAG: GDP-mannose 4,6-dehydratase, partial [Pseudomonadota bacterium]